MAIVAAMVVIAAAFVDQRATVDAIPPDEPICGSPQATQPPPLCPVLEQVILSRLVRTEALEVGYESRAPVYSLLIIVIAGAYLIVNLRSPGTDRTHQAFCDVAYCGIAWVIGVGLYYTLADAGPIGIPPAPAFAPAPAMLIIGGLGVLAAPRLSRRVGPRPAHSTASTWVVRVGMAATGLTILVALHASGSGPRCAPDEQVPDWRDTGVTIGLIAAAAAAVSGVLAMATRRWIVGWVLLVVAPLTALYTAVWAACLS